MRVALLSGGSKGIGKGAVIQLLIDGFSVVTFSRNAEQVSTLRRELRSQFPDDRFLVLQADVDAQSDVSRVVAETMKRYGRIDILINNAGFGYFSEADQVDLKIFAQMIHTNIFSLAVLTKAVLPHMKKQKSGLIINMASISGQRAMPLGEFYSATKFGVMGYSDGLRKEVAEFGIKVCTVCPGMVQTDFFSVQELQRRKKRWGGKIPQMLAVDDIRRVLSLIWAQAPHCDIQDIVMMPFEPVK